MDSWERHFVEKSRRRFERERSERRSRQMKVVITAAVLGVVILSLLISLTVFS